MERQPSLRERLERVQHKPAADRHLRVILAAIERVERKCIARRLQKTA